MDMAKYKKALLDEFEQRNDEWSFGDFERRLGEIKKGATYQNAKPIITEAHRIGAWPKTVKRYIITNYMAFGNVSSELNGVLDSIVSQMTPEEKKSLGIS